jgi:hypothetical protein
MWVGQMDGFRFTIHNADLAGARANAFLRRFLTEGDYEVRYPAHESNGWLVSFNILPVVEAATAARAKEHKRGGLRAKRVPTAAATRRRLAYRSATPLFVDWTTGRVDWYRGPARGSGRA